MKRYSAGALYPCDEVYLCDDVDNAPPKVCKWVLRYVDHGTRKAYHTDCANITPVTPHKFCPYCGGEIEVNQ